MEINKINLKKYWQVFCLYRRLRFLRMLEYRTDTSFWLVVNVMWTIFQLFFMHAIVKVTGNIQGWGYYEMMLLFGIFNIMDFFTWGVFDGNMRLYTTAVYSGELSNYLTKPIDLQFTLMTQYNNFHNLFRSLLGVIMVAVASVNLGLTFSIFNLAYCLIAIACSILFLYSLWFMISTLSFWIEHFESSHFLLPNLRALWQFPRSFYSGSAAIVLNVIAPFGMITSLPAEALLGRASWINLGYFCIYTAVALYLSRRLLKFGLKKYQSAGG